MDYERKKYPDFSWSSSRYAVFKDCPRMYYYQYYGSHNGWEDDASKEAKIAYLLKNLSSFYMVLGKEVHKVAAASIIRARDRGMQYSFKELLGSVRSGLNKAYSDSQNKDMWKRYTRDYIMIHDFYYGNSISEKFINRINQKAQACCENLVSSKSYREALVSPSVEIRDVETFTSYDINGINIYAVPDLIYRYGDDTWIITDWKTGESGNGHLEQLKVYALYVHKIHCSKPTKLIGRLEYLSRGENLEIEITMSDLKQITRYIEDSVACMRKYLLDPIKNKPRNKEEFTMRDDVGSCKQCKFYELCEEEIKSKLSGPF